MTNDPKTPPSPVTIQAKSLEQAIVKAAGTLGVGQDQVRYEVTRQEHTKGFLSFFKNSIVEIQAWKTPETGFKRGHGVAEARPSGEKNLPPCDAPKGDTSESKGAQPLSEAKLQALIEELRDFCGGIVSRMVGEPVTVKAEVAEGRLVLDIESEYMAQQFNRNSKLAEAMEHILRKKPRHLRQELPFRIFVDVGSMRRKREEELIQMAFDLSAKVHENRRPIVLNYKSSYDRKIIHMALDKDNRVYTKSIGSGPNRKLMILPSREGQGVSESTI